MTFPRRGCAQNPSSNLTYPHRGARSPTRGSRTVGKVVGRIPRRQPAVTTATFALLAPVLFLVLFGAMEGGRLLFDWIVITNEAREAARFGAVNYGRTDVDVRTITLTHLNQRLAAVLSPSGLNPPPAVTISPDPARSVHVRISYQVPLHIPLVSNILPNPFPLRAESRMRGE